MVTRVKRVKKVATAAGVKVKAAAATAKTRVAGAVTKAMEIMAAATAVVISVVTVREILTLREKRDVLAKDLAALEQDLKAREDAVIQALRSGYLPGPGCPPIALKEDKLPLRPKWKDEALVLAEKLGLNKEVYEAEVRARVEQETPPEKRVTWKLVINGNGK